MTDIISIKNLQKTYASGHQALKSVDLAIKEGEILALLGPNGAGKTTLISIVCGIVNASSGNVVVDGFDVVRDYRKTRSMIGLVPQELTLGTFDTVWNTICLSRGLFGKKPDAVYLEQLLKDLSLLEKKNSEIRALSGGMKRRVLIAKALAHQPKILFLDEPTAGVDVELRKDMWRIIERLRADGVTIILTTHYIEEAEAIADRVGVINHGELLLIEEKDALMKKMGKKHMSIQLKQPITEIADNLKPYDLELSNDGYELTYTYDTHADKTGITRLIQDISQAGLVLHDLKTTQSSLEDIFVNLVTQDN